ncbi:MAG: class I SAM-dependent methyltransferase [Synergistaceae bacterium]|jgi:predicted O-methyltransferase YrrM|nr:class I SAM-dependent methyltransferase [Synergistaceae bacterium]
MLRLKDLAVAPERCEAERLERVEGKIMDVSLMSHDERLFINGLVRLLRPKKVLEVGVADGGGTCVLLNAVDDDAVVHSVDIGSTAGARAFELFGAEARWRRHFGADVSEVIEEIGGGIDFMVLDTVHVHPAETLSFIAVFPFLAPDAVVVLHDVNEWGLSSYEYWQCCATQLLLDSVTADKFTLSEFLNGCRHPNIAAFQVNHDTRKYIADVFRSLFLPWGYDAPWSCTVPERVLRALVLSLLPNPCVELLRRVRRRLRGQ